MKFDNDLRRNIQSFHYSSATGRLQNRCTILRLIFNESSTKNRFSDASFACLLKMFSLGLAMNPTVGGTRNMLCTDY